MTAEKWIILIILITPLAIVWITRLVDARKRKREMTFTPTTLPAPAEQGEHRIVTAGSDDGTRSRVRRARISKRRPE